MLDIQADGGGIADAGQRGYFALTSALSRAIETANSFQHNGSGC